MKSKLMLLLLPLFFLVLTGCQKTEEESKQQSVDGKVINYTDCKDFQAKSVKTESNESCVEYTFSAVDNKLILKHINSGFNCCPGDLYCNITFKNDTLEIEEFESSALCYCNCLFDIDIEVTDIEAGQYFVRFIEPYCGDQEKLEFIIDLQQNPNGEYCVERNQYPWGII